VNNRLNTNKKAASSRLFLIIAALIIISGVAIIFFLSSGGAPEPDDKVVRKSIRVTDPTRATEEAAEGSKTRVTTAPVKTAQAKAVTSAKAVSAKAVPAKAASSAKAVPAKAVAPAKAVPAKAASSGKKRVAKANHETYAIHVASFHGEKYARRLERAIDRVGYNAYVTTFVKDGVTWHRVRVGFFGSKDDAKKTSAIISKRFKQPGAWIVRPPKAEIEKNKI